MNRVLAIAAILLAAMTAAFAQTVPLGPRFVLPYQTVVDSTGAPIPGALLYFYASGTKTKLNTYSDPLLTVPNANPVQANAAGVFPTIFMNGNYKIVLTDSFNNQIWTADPVDGRSGNAVALEIEPGITTIVPTTNGGVLYDNNGVLGDSTTLPSGLTIPNPTITGSLAISGSNSLATSTIEAVAGTPSSYTTPGFNFVDNPNFASFGDTNFHDSFVIIGGKPQGLFSTTTGSYNLFSASYYGAGGDTSSFFVADQAIMSPFYNGTPGSYNIAGRFFSGADNIVIPSGMVVSEATGREIDVSTVLSSGVTADRHGVRIIDLSSASSNYPATSDTGLSILRSSSSALGFNYGLYFGDPNAAVTLNALPIPTGGTLIGAQAGTAFLGIDLSSVTFSGSGACSFKSVSFCIDGAGNLYVASNIYGPSGNNINILAASGEQVVLGVNGTGGIAAANNAYFYPVTNDAISLGSSANRWSSVWAVNADLSGDVMIGTNTPTAPLTITPQTATLPTPQSGTQIHLIGANSTSAVIEWNTYAANGSFAFFRADGSLGSETMPAAGEAIGAIAFRGYNSSGYNTTNAAVVATKTVGAWSASNTGTVIYFATTAQNATSNAIAMSIYAGVVIGSGTTDPGSGNLAVGGNAALGNSSTDYVEVAGGSAGATINTNGGTLGIGANGNTGIAFSSAGVASLYNQSTSGTIAYALCAASGANGSGGGALILSTSNCFSAVGSITIGTTTVASGTTGYLLYDNGGTLGNETISSAASGGMVIGNASTYYVEINGNAATSTINTNGGGLDIGTATLALQIASNGNISLFNQTTSGTPAYAVCAASGANGNGGGALILDSANCISSLEETKDIIAGLGNVLPEIMKLWPFEYRYKKGYGDGGAHVQIGMGAHQIESIDPRMAAYDSDGRLEGIRYAQSVAYAFRGIQNIIEACEVTANDNFCVELLKRAK